MRLLRIEVAGGDGDVVVPLHPRCTVVTGMGEEARRRLVEALASAPGGGPVDLGGEAEVGGTTFPLADALARAGLVPGADLVVLPEQLPGQDREAVRAAERRRAAESERADVDRRLTAARDRLAAAEAAREEATDALEALENGEDEGVVWTRRSEELQVRLAEADERQHEAQQGLLEAEARLTALTVEPGDADDAELRLARARDAREAAAAGLADAVDAVVAARSALDPEVDDDLIAARAALAAAEVDHRAAAAAVAVANGDDGDAAGPALSAHARRDEIRYSLAALSDTDPEPVRRALESLDVVRPDDLRLLADRWDLLASVADEDADEDDYDDDYGDAGDDPDAADPGGDDPFEAAAGSGGDNDDIELAAARLRVTQARLALEEAETSSSLVSATPELVEQLEAAHSAVLAAQEKADNRFGKARARKALDAARSAEQELLDLLGLTTYADFVMSSAPTSAADDALETARDDLADATGALDEVLAGGSPAAVAAERDRVRDLAVDLLGADPGDDVAGALRAAADDLSEPGSEAEAEQPDLRALLVEVGQLPPEGDFPQGAIVGVAHDWVREQEGVAARREELEEALALVDAEIAAVEAPAGVAAGDDDDADQVDPIEALDRATAAVDAAQEEVRLAEERLASHAAATAATTGAEAALALAGEADEAAAVDLAEAEAAFTAATSAMRSEDADAARAAVDLAADRRARATAEAIAVRSDIDVLGPAPDGSAPDPRAGLEALLASSATELGVAAGEVRALELEFSSLERRVAELRALPTVGPTLSAAARAELAEDVEFFLLGRMAAQREAAEGGSVPLVLDDPFSAVPALDSSRLVAAIEPMADVVQLVILSDDPALVEWAGGLGEERAAAVSLG